MKAVLLILLFILIIGVIIMVWPFKNYNIVETREFNSIKGFSFSYPVFNGWGVKTIKCDNENLCRIFLNWPDTIDFESAPQIKVEKRSNPQNVKTTVSPLGIPYAFLVDYSLYSPGYKPPAEHYDYLMFQNSKIEARIYVSDFPEKYGFSKKAFSEKVVETFRFG